MATCVYPYCSSFSAESGSVRYYRFPEDEELRKKWMSKIPQVLNLSKDKINSRSYLCANHFRSDCFVFGDDGKVKSLKQYAIPAIFHIPPNPSVATTMSKEDEDDPDIIMEEEEVSANAFHGSSSAVLVKKLQAEQASLFIWKEKIKKEEEEFTKVSEQLRCLESGDRSWEVEETYQKLLKKMRPIAPKLPQKKKPKILEEIIVSLRKEHKISEEAAVVLLYLFADVAIDDNSSVPPSAKDSLTCFGQVLIFYSASAFEDIRLTFDVKFPKISLLRSLYNGQYGEPGWSREAFHDLRKESKKYGIDRKLLCSLLMAEFSLRREEEWDGKKIRGFVDYGPLVTNNSFDMDVDGLPTARSALVLMVTPLDQQQCWKVPIAYFFVNNLTSSEKANIIKECIMRLHSTGVVVLSLTLKLHVWEKSLLDSLGVGIDFLPNLRPYFVHPSDPLLRIHVIFDHCTVMTAVQNLWYSLQYFKDSKGRPIEWKYVSELLKIQEAQSAIFTSPIWCWEPDHLKNRLLAQVFSSDTADAIEYCLTELKLEQFEGCEGTVEFIRTMTNISLVLNSKKLCKQKSNILSTSHLQLLEYLSKLLDYDGNTLYNSSEGAFHYLYITLMSCQELLRQVPCFSSNAVSLDHLEVLFYIIRSYIGWNVIPTARQFTAAFTNHVTKHGYISSWTCAQTNTQWWIDSQDVAIARREGRSACEPVVPAPPFPVYGTLPIIYENVYPIIEFALLSPYQFSAIFVVKSLAGILHCDACLLALQEPFLTDNPLLLLLRKTFGAFICPSRDVLRVCATAERYFQIHLKISKRKPKLSIFEWNDEEFISKLGISVMEDLLERKPNIFSCLNDHLNDCAPDANHLYRLVRGITCSYVRMRLRKCKSWCPV